MKTELISELDVADLEFQTEEALKEQPKTAKRPEHYINNKQLQEEFVKYYAAKQQWIADGKEGVPPLTHAIGLAVLQIAKRRTYSRNFVSYTQQWKEEMTDDAIEACVKYAHNYNPTKYDNPFAYLTQIVTNAIKERIKIEKKQLYIKYKSFDNSHGFNGEIDDTLDEDAVESMKETTDMYSGYLEYIADYESANFNKRSVDKKTDDGIIIDDFMESNEEET